MTRQSRGSGSGRSSRRGRAGRNAAGSPASRETTGAKLSDATDALADALFRASSLLVRRVRLGDQRHGVNPGRTAALNVLVDAGPLTAGDLARIQEVTPATMSRLIAALERDGMVTRKPDADDARVVRLRATANGKREALRCRRIRTAELHAVIDELSTRDQASLRRAAEILRRALTKH